jgi:hypothetical protein
VAGQRLNREAANGCVSVLNHLRAILAGDDLEAVVLD